MILSLKMTKQNYKLRKTSPDKSPTNRDGLVLLQRGLASIRQLCRILMLQLLVVQQATAQQCTGPTTLSLPSSLVLPSPYTYQIDNGYYSWTLPAYT